MSYSIHVAICSIPRACWKVSKVIIDRARMGRGLTDCTWVGFNEQFQGEMDQREHGQPLAPLLNGTELVTGVAIVQLREETKQRLGETRREAGRKKEEIAEVKKEGKERGKDQTKRTRNQTLLRNAFF